MGALLSVGITLVLVRFVIFKLTVTIEKSKPWICPWTWIIPRKFFWFRKLVQMSRHARCLNGNQVATDTFQIERKIKKVITESILLQKGMQKNQQKY